MNLGILISKKKKNIDIPVMDIGFVYFGIVLVIRFAYFRTFCITVPFDLLLLFCGYVNMEFYVM